MYKAVLWTFWPEIFWKYYLVATKNFLELPRKFVKTVHCSQWFLIEVYLTKIFSPVENSDEFFNEFFPTNFFLTNFFRRIISLQWFPLIIFFWYVDSYAKIFLILYPPVWKHHNPYCHNFIHSFCHVFGAKSLKKTLLRLPFLQVF